MLDYDGTVAKSSFAEKVAFPTPKVLKAFNDSQKKLITCLVTARPLKSMEPILKVLNTSSYTVLLGGAQIIDSQTLKTVWYKSLNPATVKKIYKISRSYKLKTISSDLTKEFVVNKSTQNTSPVAGIFFPRILKSQIKDLEIDLSDFSDIVIHRVLADKKSRYEALTINHVKSTKAHAINHLSQLLNINRQQIIGVGDGPNDFPLLMASGLKIAMGNSVKELKAIADFIAPTVDDDGVATIINKLIL